MSIALKTVADLVSRLRELHRRTQETPLFNPVFQLAHDLSRELESGELSLDDFSTLIAELETRSLEARADRMCDLVTPQNTAKRMTGFCSDTTGFEAFRERWSHPQLHVVFTAHPTFLLTPAQTDVVAEAASGGDAVAPVEVERPEITLRYEHSRAMAAMANAQDARDAINTSLFECAASEWPDQWRALEPLPFRFASWVGYDMDGRTDITWYTSISFRLAEKAQRLERYADQLAQIDPDHSLVETLRKAQARTKLSADEFAGDLSDRADLSAAANRLTAGGDDKLLSLTPIIRQLEEEALSAEQDEAIALKGLAAAMRADEMR